MRWRSPNWITSLQAVSGWNRSFACLHIFIYIFNSLLQKEASQQGEVWVATFLPAVLLLYLQGAFLFDMEGHSILYKAPNHIYKWHPLHLQFKAVLSSLLWQDYITPVHCVYRLLPNYLSVVIESWTAPLQIAPCLEQFIYLYVSKNRNILLYEANQLGAHGTHQCFLASAYLVAAIPLL